MSRRNRCGLGRQDSFPSLTVLKQIPAESVVRGRCRAIVRVPWDDLLSSRPGLVQADPDQASPDQQPALQPQTRLAYTALAGVLIAGLAAMNPPNTTNTPNTTSAVPGRNPGEHAD